MKQYDQLWRYIQINCSDGEIITYDKVEEMADVHIGADFAMYKNELIEYGFRIDEINKVKRYFVVKVI